MRMQATLLVVALALAGMAVPAPAWAQSELRSGRFTTSDGVELHYLEAGSGPALVFVPGFTMPAEIWEPQLRHFATSHRVIALDPRSQGRSGKPAEGHYLARRGQDIGELIAHLGAAPAVVVGWSLGVLEVLTYVQESGTANLRAVALVDMFIGVDQEPGLLHPSAPLWTRWIEGIQLNRRAWTREWVQGFFRSDQPDEYFDTLTEAVLATPTNTAVTLLTNLMFMGPTDLRPALDALDRPVLYVVTSLGWAEIVRARRADVRVDVFENAGHALFVDEAERFNRLLEEFLAMLLKN
jgi:non-heme chloroperoxidase